MPNVLLTGASGFVGQEIFSQLLKRDGFNISVLTSDCKRLKSLPEVDKKNITCFGRDQIEEAFKVPPNYVINCSFARSNKGELLANSLDFTRKLYEEAVVSDVPGVINISTQSVYGEPYEPLWTEDTPVVANSLYAMAKYATEVMSQCFSDQLSCRTNFTNIRLSSLSGPGFDVRLTAKFVKSAIAGKPIEIKGGNQLLSLLDVRDAAEGIIELLKLNPKEWRSTYNLGSPWQYTILEVAEIVKQVAKIYTDKEVVIRVNGESDDFKSGIDSSLFYGQTKWKPQFKMEDMIRDLFEHYHLQDARQNK